MAKVMLVEDDNNLGEIYQARLAAEGYEIVSAKDGEEALAIAVKEKPDLIICDVMMPKVSGFEVLDILRSTAGIKDTKVIMMTALGQAEDKQRAEKLGADRYLVKSQVTLEDMVKTVQEVLKADKEEPQPPASPEQLLTSAADTLTKPADNTGTDSKSADTKPQADPIKIPVSTTDDNSSSDDDDDDTGSVTIAKKKIIQPLNDLSEPNNNLDELLAKEDAKEELSKQEEPPKPIVIDNSKKESDNTETASSDDTETTHTPGEVITPQDNQTPTDPSSIAL